MKDKFQMSSMGELTFFLGLQVQQKEDGIFISQDKYVDEILKKFNSTIVKSASTPVDLEKPLVKDGDVNDVDVHLYRSMIGSLMYLTASRRNITFAVCACARFQVTPKTSHLLAVKRDFRYLKGKPTLGLWLISWQFKKQTVVVTSTTKAEYVATASCYLLIKGFDAGRHVKRGWDTKIPQSSGPPVKVGDEAVHKELGDRMERAATTASSLEAEQDSVFRFIKEKDQERGHKEVCEIASSKSTPLVPPPETPPLSAPKPKEDSKPNPYQPPIPYPFPLFLLTLSLSLSPSLTPSGEISLLLKETDAFLSLDDSIPPGIDNGIYDSEGDILFLEELLNDDNPERSPLL
ncbi:uncharacterized mitochondrial protein-like protein [Tanacetum coccineum]